MVDTKNQYNALTIEEVEFEEEPEIGEEEEPLARTSRQSKKHTNIPRKKIRISQYERKVKETRSPAKKPTKAASSENRRLSQL